MVNCDSNYLLHPYRQQTIQKVIDSICRQMRKFLPSLNRVQFLTFVMCGCVSVEVNNKCEHITTLNRLTHSV